MIGLAEILLTRLHRVKQTGPDSWLALCPAHDDKSPSLTVRETADGKVLLHCFAECPAADVLAAVGLTFTDIYPEPIAHHLPPTRKPFPAVAVLEAVAQEAAIVLVCASALRQEKPLPPEDHARLCVAVDRLQAALDVVRG